MELNLVLNLGVCALLIFSWFLSLPPLGMHCVLCAVISENIGLKFLVTFDKM